MGCRFIRLIMKYNCIRIVSNGDREKEYPELDRTLRGRPNPDLIIGKRAVPFAELRSVAHTQRWVLRVFKGDRDRPQGSWDAFSAGQSTALALWALLVACLHVRTVFIPTQIHDYI